MNEKESKKDYNLISELFKIIELQQTMLGYFNDRIRDLEKELNYELGMDDKK